MRALALFLAILGLCAILMSALFVASAGGARIERPDLRKGLWVTRVYMNE